MSWHKKKRTPASIAFVFLFKVTPTLFLGFLWGPRQQQITAMSDKIREERQKGADAIINFSNSMDLSHGITNLSFVMATRKTEKPTRKHFIDSSKFAEKGTNCNYYWMVYKRVLLLLLNSPTWPLGRMSVSINYYARMTFNSNSCPKIKSPFRFSPEVGSFPKSTSFILLTYSALLFQKCTTNKRKTV